ncbi:protein-L-isoaspartate(D-aspartate) O-methyltransferase [Candidatus Fervidibacter sacchari]|uniref:Protein-L-isoaspartate O-methyltransferase n=1 Tax=Candidatus Fervidibacter sacchari TaxID=1448929 RepID=A0ABT2ERY9_9BACT|nr:protein-L-isoaspartate(D-aspartate) O-methyltransferase [Candidatus Fervidibacter sacchari]
MRGLLLSRDDGKRVGTEEQLAQMRANMVEYQLRRRGIKDERVLQAFLKVPRHKFVRPQDMWHAYEDYPLAIGYGQTISQPYMVAIMTELLELKGHERVLEIGTGSGYQAAILAELAKEVFTIERIPELAKKAEKVLRELGYNNVKVIIGDGSKGLPEFAPYDGIIVTAAAPKLPQPLLEQLKDGGRLVIPVGSRKLQDLLRITRIGNEFKTENFGPCLFVPLIGEEGWKGENILGEGWSNEA